MNIGVLVIGHGSPDPHWTRMVEDTVRAAGLSYVTFVAFLEGNEQTSIAGGIDRLERQGVTDIVVVPLFISSFTTHVNEIQYALGIVEHPSFETDLAPIPHSAHIHFCEPMNDHRLISEIMVEKIDRQGFTANRHGLILAAHGVNDEAIFRMYAKTMDRIVKQIGEGLGVSGVEYGTFYPATLRHTVAHVGELMEPFVVPYFLSEGHFTKKVIPAKLDGLRCDYRGIALLPHRNVALWIREQVEAMATLVLQCSFY